MPTTHVFIVDSITFRYHMEYLFAGTGAGDNYVDFNNFFGSALNPGTERKLVSMMADISRIRINDLIIFYLQQNNKKKIEDGKFYGIFQATSEPFFDNLITLDQELILNENYNFSFRNLPIEINSNHLKIKNVFSENDRIKFLNIINDLDKKEIIRCLDRYYENNQYLLKDLQKSLLFRVKIAPFEVYPDGVTEWEALDSINNLQSPNQMLWSLIYRKLRGNRGCTPITSYESDRLCNLIRERNNNHIQNSSLFTFNDENQRIEAAHVPHQYEGNIEVIEINPRLIRRYNINQTFEVHLQTYILKSLGKNINESLDRILIGNSELQWLGNEVSCGVGMQKIDILYTLNNGENQKHFCVELKGEYAYEGIISQITRYISWMQMYFVPNIPGQLIPVIITKKIPDNNINHNNYFKFNGDGTKSEYYNLLINNFITFNNNNQLNLKFVEYEIIDNEIIFCEITY